MDYEVSSSGFFFLGWLIVREKRAGTSVKTNSAAGRGADEGFLTYLFAGSDEKRENEIKIPD